MGVQEGQRPNVAQKATMVLRMVLFVGRHKGGYLRHEDEAQQQQYIHVWPLGAPTN